MKEKLKKLLAQKEARKVDLGKRSETCEDLTELRSINTELQNLNAEIRDLEEMIAMPEATTAGTAGIDENGQALRTRMVNSEIPAMVVAGSVSQSPAATENRGESDPYATLEYRRAFMEYAQTGRITPELRADELTTTGDIAAMIPTTILDEVVTKLEAYGQIYQRVRKLAIKGGVKVPISAVKPVATWIGEDAVSDKQKLDVSQSVSFSYFGLECRIATSLLADTVSLNSFETLVTNLIAEAMIKAMEIGVVSGAGVESMLGVTVDTRVPAANTVTLSADEFTKWNAWKKKVFAKMPISYKAGAVFLMASGTYEGYIDGMVDTAGQPIGRTNYGITDGPQGRFGGKEVIEVEDDVIAPYDDAATGDVVAILMNMNNYAINSNLQMTLFRYFDHNTNEWIDKAVLIADGKLLDPNGVIIIKKGGS